MKSALNIIDIKKRVESAKRGLDYNTMQIFFGLMDRRSQAANQVDKGDYEAEIVEQVFDEFKENIIKVLGL